MKFANGMVSYIAVVSTLVAVSITGVSYAIAPYGTSGEAINAERAANKPASATEKTAALSAASDANRVPTWIAPTHKYPASALALNTAPRAKQIAKETSGRGDWRLNERQMSFNAPVAMSSYASDTRMQRDMPAVQETPRYREPIQFREKTEPR